MLFNVQGLNLNSTIGLEFKRLINTWISEFNNTFLNSDKLYLNADKFLLNLSSSLNLSKFLNLKFKNDKNTFLL